MEQISLQAYAKVNLTLDILGRRNDGYHQLASVMQSISLADLITLQRQDGGITIRTDDPLLPTDQTNICWRAVTAFQNHTGITGGALIEITKRIPISAGLGGGSTDAAAVLHGLNRLYSTNLELKELQALGVKIGADVPFCLQGGTALVRGIGEQITALRPFPEATLVLVKPKVGISTAEVYQGLSPSAYGGTSTQALLDLLSAQEPTPVLSTVLDNALETVTVQLVPEVAVWKKRLLAHGAHQALMSGSGPTVFGLFSNEEQAREFQTIWQEQGAVFVVTPVPSGVEQQNGGDRR